MKTFALSVVFAAMGMLAASVSVDTQPSSSAQPAGVLPAASAAPMARTQSAPGGATSVPPATPTKVVQQYCVGCHNDKLKTGNISFEGLDVEKVGAHAQAVEKMIRKLRAGMMPPPGAARPSPETLQMLVETLESKVDQAARVAPNLGERRFQRLSRVEYRRAIQDLLALEVDAGKWLPPDALLGSFDNMSDAQGLSTTLLEAYLRAASEVSRLAIGDSTVQSTTTKIASLPETSQHAWDRVDGTPFGTRGGLVATYDFPADGEYVFKVTPRMRDKLFSEDVDISVDGEPIARLMFPHAPPSEFGVQRANQGPPGVSAVVETEPIFVRAGQRRVSVAFAKIIDGPYDDVFAPTGWSSAGVTAPGYGITTLTHIGELSITGPTKVTGVSDTDSRRAIFTCRPTSAAKQQRACAQTILSRLASEAYRRPVRPNDMTELMKFYDEAAATDGFEVGVRMGLQAILISPTFLFRLERVPSGARPGQEFRLNDVELATRLAFFLWASPPDQELLDVAGRGRLSDPATLERQVRRMLKDLRAETLSTRFAHQWLRLQDVGRVWPEPFYYPDFSRQLAESMVKETETFFQNLIREDSSLLELYNADYTFLNERLAEHYGIEGVGGEAFRKVPYPDDQRRGLLGHGSVLLLTSMSTRTSPVMRGKWVMEVLMGTPPPLPPPNVPAFETSSPEASAGRRLTTRERIEIHRANPVCSACHRFMDPIGLSIDNFDVVGQWRIRENMAPLDTRGIFYDGTPIAKPSDLMQVLLKRPIPLVRNFAEQLLSYAIGRPADYYDQPTIRAVTRAAGANNYRMSSFIMGVVKSDVFQKRQVQAQSTAN